MATLEMWTNVMYDGMDINGIDNQPLRNSNKVNSIFFIIFIVFGSFFMLNLFVGVTIDKVLLI